MAKRNQLLMLGAGLAGAAYFRKKNNRQKAMDLINSMRDQAMKMMGKDQNKNIEPTIKKAAYPDPYDIPDNEMVAEGSLYGIDYYNREKQTT
ncbi:hypothetical protein D0469_17050 [Peribacillus saganii]|uniref:Uncharacterized protein n=1 Tax=Peribacillus saganii TaxID=2303992 RepID=A0A372LIX7_9BACI|nr:hypothetical protein [Peribacillus saganii]RFU66345.1 hypothetical protein D0469_17050 [Peribacillus saganii]